MKLKWYWWVAIAVVVIAITLTIIYQRYLKNVYTIEDLTNFGGTNEQTGKPMYYLSVTSLARLNRVDPVLISIFKEAIKNSPHDFGIASGFRTTAEQQALYAKGRTAPGKIVTYADGVKNKSYHQSGKAVDIYAYINGKANWETKYYEPIARHIQEVAKNKFGVNLQWGGDWTKFKDYPHFQI